MLDVLIPVAIKLKEIKNERKMNLVAEKIKKSSTRRYVIY